MTTQTERLHLGSRLLLCELVPASNVTPGGIHLPGKVKPTNIWKALKVGPDFEFFPDLQVGEHVIPEKVHSVEIDGKILSIVHETRIFGVTPAMTSQLEKLRLQPKFLIAKQVKIEASALIQLPQQATSFWRVIKLGSGFTKYEGLAVGDEIVPEKHARVTLDRQPYAMINEDWILGHMPATKQPSEQTSASARP